LSTCESDRFLREYKEILDVPKLTNLIEHKVEPVSCKAYPTPYKMQEIVDKEINDFLVVLMKKPDNIHRVCVNFKELNKITVFDPETMMYHDNIFPKLGPLNTQTLCNLLTPVAWGCHTKIK